MNSRNAIKILVWALIFILGMFIDRSLGQIVVFPIRDLTVDPPGIDLKLTDKIAKALKRRGDIVISGDELYSALSSKGIYATGLPGASKVALSYELKGSTMLWGAKIEADGKKHLFGIVLFATSVPDGKTYWSKVFYYQPEEHLLNLGNNLSIEQMEDRIADEVVKSFPGEKIGKEILPSGFQVEHFSLFPRYVKDGDEVNLLLKPVGKPKTDSITIHIDGKAVTLRRNDGAYTGIFIPNLGDGKYPVFLYENGKKLMLDELTVDNVPPKIYLTIKGLKKAGKIYFANDKLLLTAGLKEPDSIMRWDLTISDFQGKEIFKRFGNGAPVIAITWNPVKALTQEGIYKISLKVTDVAGNTAFLEKKFYYFHNIPAPEITIYKTQEGKTAIMIKSIKIPDKLKKIRIVVFSPKGYPLGETEIKKLPAEVIFDSDFNKLKVRLFMQDEIGNKLEKDYELKVKSYREMEEQRGWVEEF
ncbi:MULTISPECIES: Ig-like domain-containing protein [unclassified Desulfurobacterium]|uniref:hypothetical protein n=1 Tax=Desulfurobacterium sp. TC5-1 TaxID=1158318 RepID=UPI0003B2F35B|nr:hypothetical protein [Desulfurobacterium sp. TC5-1]